MQNGCLVVEKNVAALLKDCIEIEATAHSFAIILPTMLHTVSVSVLCAAATTFFKR